MPRVLNQAAGKTSETSTGPEYLRTTGWPRRQSWAVFITNIALRLKRRKPDLFLRITGPHDGLGSSVEHYSDKNLTANTLSNVFFACVPHSRFVMRVTRPAGRLRLDLR